MKKLFDIATAAICMFALNVTAMAQEYMDRDLVITKNAGLWLANNEPIQLDPATDKVTLRVFSFGGDGNTVIVKVDAPNLKKQLESQGTKISFEYGWSGKNVHLVKQIEQGCEVYAVIRGSNVYCGGLMNVPKDGKKIWAVQVNNTGKEHCIHEFHIGMNRLGVESEMAKTGFGKFVFARNEGDMKVYQVQGLDMKKKQHGFGQEDYHYEMRNDTPYMSFWFDSQDRLVKWLMH